ncbi:hypothetical protein N7541_003189 [Penicillium brevicompactum]|uniref:AB hydrolase-1 domain-containing protein n=1 Tax=Penicillium brevicompactum TaxID=5074 RepID=A0A9W9RLD0_PENBR|nr:hypothetical protein N7541_003189 [Penicillium brevicompactum]
MFEDPSPSPSNSSLPIPKDHGELNKRKLLLIYIHGFMGSEASFLRFPAHVHQALMILLGKTHIIYTRIYPQYKCRGEMKDAIEQFSTWLSPHEADDLDVILLGHSIGGALAAGVMLLPDLANTYRHPRKHRILGLVNFDVPFLGLHPRVIFSGIRSLFRRTEDVNGAVPDKSGGLEEMDHSLFPIVTNPNFDPCFGNDVRLPKHRRLQRALRFLQKNIYHLPSAIFDSLMSFYKFPGYLNRWPHLRRQYKEMMSLEAAEIGVDRVRFVNYYTESNGGRIVSQSPRSHRPCDSGDEHKSNVDCFYNAKSASAITILTDTYEHPMGHAVSTGSADSRGNPESEVKMDQTKSRSFVLKPSHHWKDGENSLWKPIPMKGMDEVKAHQSMFLPDSNEYEELVGDTVGIIEHWVQDDMSARMLGMEETAS